MDDGKELESWEQLADDAVFAPVFKLVTVGTDLDKFHRNNNLGSGDDMKDAGDR